MTRLGEPELLDVAEARKAVDEDEHATSVQAAVEALARSARGDLYVDVRRRLVLTHLQAGLREDEASSETARLLQLAVDDAVLALLTSDAIPPKHLRELYRPWHGALVEPADPPRSQA